MRTAARLLLLAWLVASAPPVGAARAETARADFEIVPLAVAARDANAPREPVYAASSNAAGELAYVSAGPSGPRLELRDGVGIVRAVIGAGDALAGSTVTDIVTTANALDASQQIVFWAALADGRAGLFRASPPPVPFAISPTVGYRDQPITVQIIGRGFAPGLEVQIGGTKAGLVTVESPTELTGVLPAGVPVGRFDVVVGRRGGAPHVLAKAFEVRERPASGCRGFWPDHRPPVITTAALASDWLVPFAIVAAPGAWRRLSRRRAPRRPRRRAS